MFIRSGVHYLISVYQNIIKMGLGLSHEAPERVRRVFTDQQPVGIQQSLKLMKELGEFSQICSLWEYNKAWFACLLF